MLVITLVFVFEPDLNFTHIILYYKILPQNDNHIHVKVLWKDLTRIYRSSYITMDVEQKIGKSNALQPFFLRNWCASVPLFSIQNFS